MGILGEQFAREYVERSLGWRVCCCNWRCPIGELDIVAQDADCLVIIEVKTRRTYAYGTPTESVDSMKIRRLLRVIPYLLRSLHWQEEVGPVRLDVIALTVQADSVRHLIHLQGVGADG